MDPLIIKNRRCQSLVWNDRQNIPSDWNEWFGTCEYNVIMGVCFVVCNAVESTTNGCLKNT